MAQPEPYVLDYDFVGWQISNPTRPLPAAKLEIEFNAIEDTTDQILYNLALIQRDDGQLRNRTVGYDQLSLELAQDIAAGIREPEAWATGELYSARDSVFVGSKLYRAKVDHVSGALFATDLALDKWEELTDLATGAGVITSFNTRVGAVVPEVGDYAAFYQPLDSDLTAIAAVSTTAYGRALLALADEAALKAGLNLEIGVDVQAYDADLTTWAGLTPSADAQSLVTAANYAAMRALLDLEVGTDFLSPAAIAAAYQPLDADLTSIAAVSTTAYGRSFLALADAAAAQTLAGLVIGANVQAYDADLTTWAGLTPSANAQSLVTAANYAAMRALLDLEAGTDFYSIAAANAAFQPLDTELTALAGLASAANALPYFTGSGTAAVTTLSAYGRSLIDDADAAAARSTLGLGTMAVEAAATYLTVAAAAAGYQPLDADLTTWAGLTPSANAQSLVTAANYAAMRTLLDLEVGTDFLSPAAIAAAYQPLDAELTALAGLTSAADKGIQFTGSGTAGVYDLTAFAKTFLDDANAGAVRTTLGLAIGTDVQAFDALLDDIAALTGPGADRILFWDDSAGELTWLTIGTNLTITGTTLNASGGGGGGGLSDGDYGDITVSAASTVLTIDNDVVTYAKMQNVGANSVLARADASSGDVGEVALAASELLGRGSTGNVAAIALGTGLSMSGTTLSGGREILTAARTYYVRTDGNDSNTGLANTSGGAFLTIQKALDVTAALDRSIYQVTIQVGSGTYTSGGDWAGGSGTGWVTITGDTTTPSNVVISTTSANCLTIRASIYIEGFKFTTTTSGYCIHVINGAAARLNGACEFGAVGTGSSQIRIDDNSVFQCGVSYTISGGAYAHILADVGGVVVMYNNTITLTGTPAFAGSFLRCTGGYASMYTVTFSGAATGQRYYMGEGGFFTTFGSSLALIPGDSGGITPLPQTIIQNADRTLTSSTATQKLFDTATNGTLTLPTGRYTFSCLLYVTTMNATTGNMAFHILGGGSATLGTILYQTDGIDHTSPLNAGARTGSASVTSASVASVVTANTGTSMVVRVHGTFTVTAAGTIIPSCALVTANAAVLKAGSHFECRRFADSGTNYTGEWS